MKTLEETIRELKEIYKENLLYIGLRGSHCINLEREESDYDLLIVVENLKNERIQEDFITLNKETFKESFYQVHLEVVEALCRELNSPNFL